MGLLHGGTSVVVALLSLSATIHIFLFYTANAATIAAVRRQRSLIEAQPLVTPADISTCNITADEQCSPAEFKTTNGTLILPGGNTSCLWGKPYGFTYYPGSGDDAKKLLIFFQGGGACFLNKYPNLSGTCSHIAKDLNVQFTAASQVYFDDFTGVFSPVDEGNPYRSWTKVVVHYCSGDLYLGSLNRSYAYTNRTDDTQLTDEAFQRGFENTLSALTWTIRNFPSPDRLVIAGMSAGAVGAHLWSDYLLSRYSKMADSHKAVVLDSFGLSVFPANQGTVIRETGICESLQSLGLLVDEKLAHCQRGELWINEVISQVHQKHNNVPFVIVQSKIDSIQQVFYSSLALLADLKVIQITPLQLPAGVDLVYPFLPIKPDEFYRETMKVLNYFLQNSKNVLYYLRSSDQHQYFTDPNFTTVGFDSKPDKPTLVTFLSQFPLAVGEKAESLCEEDSLYPCPGIASTFTQREKAAPLPAEAITTTPAPPAPSPGSTVRSMAPDGVTTCLLSAILALGALAHLLLV